MWILGLGTEVVFVFLMAQGKKSFGMFEKIGDGGELFVRGLVGGCSSGR